MGGKSRCFYFAGLMVCVVIGLASCSLNNNNNSSSSRSNNNNNGGNNGYVQTNNQGMIIEMHNFGIPGGVSLIVGSNLTVNTSQNLKASRRWHTLGRKRDSSGVSAVTTLYKMMPNGDIYEVENLGIQIMSNMIFGNSNEMVVSNGNTNSQNVQYSNLLIVTNVITNTYCFVPTYVYNANTNYAIIVGHFQAPQGYYLPDWRDRGFLTRKSDGAVFKMDPDTVGIPENNNNYGNTSDFQPVQVDGSGNIYYLAIFYPLNGNGSQPEQTVIELNTSNPSNITASQITDPAYQPYYYLIDTNGNVGWEGNLAGNNSGNSMKKIEFQSKSINLPTDNFWLGLNDTFYYGDYVQTNSNMIFTYTNVNTNLEVVDQQINTNQWISSGQVLTDTPGAQWFTNVSTNGYLDSISGLYIENVWTNVYLAVIQTNMWTNNWGIPLWSGFTFDPNMITNFTNVLTNLQQYNGNETLQIQDISNLDPVAATFSIYGSLTNVGNTGEWGGWGNCSWIPQIWARQDLKICFPDRLIFVQPAGNGNGQLYAFEIQNPQNQPRLITSYTNAIATVTAYSVSQNYYYFAGNDYLGNAVLMKVDPRNDNYTMLVAQGTYDNYLQISVTKDDVLTFTAVTGGTSPTHAIGTIDSLGNLTVNQSSSGAIISLQRIQ
jgi:hypothetical protein